MTKLKIGILTPHRAAGPDIELPALSEGWVRTVVVHAGSPTQLSVSTETAVLQAAARTFRSSHVDAVAHASTTTGYLIGPSKEATLVDELARRCGVPAVASCAATVEALRSGGANRIQLVHPPWFDPAFDDLGVAYFRAHGFHAVATRAEELPDDPALVASDQVVDWVERHLHDQVDGLYLAGNGFRAGAAGEDLQRRTGTVVVTANQALLRARSRGVRTGRPSHRRRGTPSATISAVCAPVVPHNQDARICAALRAPPDHATLRATADRRPFATTLAAKIAR